MVGEPAFLFVLSCLVLSDRCERLRQVAILTCLDDDEDLPYDTASAAAKDFVSRGLTKDIAMYLRTRHLNMFNLVLVLLFVFYQTSSAAPCLQITHTSTSIAS